MPMRDALIYDGLRTPFGRHAGALAPVRPDDLLGGVIASLVGRNPFKPARRSRTRSWAAPIRPARTRATSRATRRCSRACRTASAATPSTGSAAAALPRSATPRARRCGEGELFVAGGVESMSRAPFVMAKATSAYCRANSDVRIRPSARAFPIRGSRQSFGADTMPETADNVAAVSSVSARRLRSLRAGSQEKYEGQGRGLLRGGDRAGEIRAGREKGAEIVWRPTSIRGPNDARIAARAEAAVRERRGDRRQCIGDQRRRGGALIGSAARPARRLARNRWRASSRRRSPASSRA